MDKSTRKAIESKIVLAVQDILKSSGAVLNDKMEKLIKSSAKQLAKKAAKADDKKKAAKKVKKEKPARKKSAAKNGKKISKSITAKKRVVKQ